MWGYFDMEQNKLVWMAATAVGAMQLARCSQRCSWSTTFRGGGCIEQRWPTVQKVILISVPGVTLIISEKLSRCSQIRQLFRVVHCFRRDQVEQLFRGFISIDFGCGPIKRTGNSKPAFKCFFYFDIENGVELLATMLPTAITIQSTLLLLISCGKPRCAY